MSAGWEESVCEQYCTDERFWRAGLRGYLWRVGRVVSGMIWKLLTVLWREVTKASTGDSYADDDTQADELAYFRTFGRSGGRFPLYDSTEDRNDLFSLVAITFALRGVDENQKEEEEEAPAYVLRRDVWPYP